MNLLTKFAIAGFIASLTLNCTKYRTNIDRSDMEEILVDFSETRLGHYLHGGSPVSNATLLEKVLARRQIKMVDFRPVLKRFEPEKDLALFGSTKK
jgi:hypothetical protein